VVYAVALNPADVFRSPLPDAIPAADGRVESLGRVVALVDARLDVQARVRGIRWSQELGPGSVAGAQNVKGYSCRRSRASCRFRGILRTQSSGVACALSAARGYLRPGHTRS
jgi:hypothetical protein